MAEEKKDGITKQWYVVNTYAGHENRVKANLERRIETMGLQDCLFRVVVAEEKEPVYDKNGNQQMKDGEPVYKVKNAFSGYVFVEMMMTAEAWYIVRNTPGVTGFIGSSGGGAQPFPVPEDEMELILRRVDSLNTKVEADFEVGDRVRILEERFKEYEGVVDSMNDEEHIASVLIFMFGRETSVDFDYRVLEKVEL